MFYVVSSFGTEDLISSSRTQTDFRLPDCATSFPGSSVTTQYLDTEIAYKSISDKKCGHFSLQRAIRDSFDLCFEKWRTSTFAAEVEDFGNLRHLKC